MEISILLTILLTILSLGRAILREGKIWLTKEEQINDYIIIKYSLKKAIYQWAVKLMIRMACLLNIVTFIGSQKADQTTLIQTQNLKYEG
ncbi:hypothetical protein [Falsiporphyromonas endometrii]|uniref:Uncharacterized protein n=1 Tax=Falsiporphyromonas endometrii TaxID=1387297 RepID=A0ABV9K5T7_9PORP